jgi:hypothetical protein
VRCRICKKKNAFQKSLGKILIYTKRLRVIKNPVKG